MIAPRTPVVLGMLSVVMAVVAIVLLSSSGGDMRTVHAEFQSARGLIDRNWVRVNGVRAGEVKDIKLTDHGTARVTMEVEKWVRAPRSRCVGLDPPVDLFGDVYVALDPGHAAAPLRGSIPMSRAANVGRLDDMLHVLQAPARAGLKAVLVELGTALDKRGIDVNRALLQTRPALRAAQTVMEELGSQRAALRTLITASDRMARSLGGRTQALGHMIDSFGDLLTTTAAHSQSMDAMLRDLPGLLSRVGGTTDRLTGAARSATPLAASLRASAPDLSTAMARLQPFLGRTDTVVDEARPTVRRAARFLGAGTTSLPRLADGLHTLRAGSASLQSLTETLKQTAPKFGPSLLAATAQQATEPGNQPFDPTTSALRRYWRGAAVLSCETFGAPLKPGCLADIVGPQPSAKARSHAARPTRPVKPLSGVTKAVPSLPLPLLPKGVSKTIGDLQHALGQSADDVKSKLPHRDDSSGAGGLLDFLLGP